MSTTENNKGKTSGKLGCKIVAIVFAVLLIFGIVIFVGIYNYVNDVSESVKDAVESAETLNGDLDDTQKKHIAGIAVLFKTVAQVEKFKGPFNNENELIDFIMSNSSRFDARTGMTTTKLSPKAIQMQSQKGLDEGIIDFVYIFKKVPNCSLEKKNCCVYIYTNVKKGENPKKQATLYYGQDGKTVFE